METECHETRLRATCFRTGKEREPIPDKSFANSQSERDVFLDLVVIRSPEEAAVLGFRVSAMRYRLPDTPQRFEQG